MSIRLQEKVRRLVAQSSMNNNEIAVVAGCSAQWVHLFKEGRIKSPSVDTMEKLYVYFTGKPLINEGDDA